jgi:hypothetical protein
VNRVPLLAVLLCQESVSTLVSRSKADPLGVACLAASNPPCGSVLRCVWDRLARGASFLACWESQWAKCSSDPHHAMPWFCPTQTASQSESDPMFTRQRAMSAENGDLLPEASRALGYGTLPPTTHQQATPWTSPRQQRRGKRSFDEFEGSPASPPLRTRVTPAALPPSSEACQSPLWVPGRGLEAIPTSSPLRGGTVPGTFLELQPARHALSSFHELSPNSPFHTVSSPPRRGHQGGRPPPNAGRDSPDSLIGHGAGIQLTPQFQFAESRESPVAELSALEESPDVRPHGRRRRFVTRSATSLSSPERDPRAFPSPAMFRAASLPPIRQPTGPTLTLAVGSPDRPSLGLHLEDTKPTGQAAPGTGGPQRLLLSPSESRFAKLVEEDYRQLLGQTTRSTADMAGPTPGRSSPRMSTSAVRDRGTKHPDLFEEEEDDDDSDGTGDSDDDDSDGRATVDDNDWHELVARGEERQRVTPPARTDPPSAVLNLDWVSFSPRRTLSCLNRTLDSQSVPSPQADGSLAVATLPRTPGLPSPSTGAQPGEAWASPKRVSPLRRLSLPVSMTITDSVNIRGVLHVSATQ